MKNNEQNNYIISLIKHRNKLSAQIIKTKRAIELLGDNESIISYLASITYTRELLDSEITSESAKLA